jgi:hypothetical protein
MVVLLENGRWSSGMSVSDSQNILFHSGRGLCSSFFTYEASSLFWFPSFFLRWVSSFEFWLRWSRVELSTSDLWLSHLLVWEGVYIHRIGELKVSSCVVVWYHEIDVLKRRGSEDVRDNHPYCYTARPISDFSDFRVWSEIKPVLLFILWYEALLSRVECFKSLDQWLAWFKRDFMYVELDDQGHWVKHLSRNDSMKKLHLTQEAASERERVMKYFPELRVCPSILDFLDE